MPAGYSGTPLTRKLGLKAGFRARIIDAPDHYLDLLGPLPDDLIIARSMRGHFDFIHVFVTTVSRLHRHLERLPAALERDGMLWVSWPKKTSALASELTGNDVRRLGLASGLVDIKVCAVDGDWSGLKFVYRRADR